MRAKIALAGGERGLAAEDYFEPLLITKFGEPYVHVQKRYYKGSKSRYDFLVYAKDRVFGIDIFTTDRKQYITNNIRHKINRYKNAPADLDIYFVLYGFQIDSSELSEVVSSISEIQNYQNMHVLVEASFLELVSSFEPLQNA